MTGDELIWELKKRGLDLGNARVVSVLLPELDPDGNWVTPVKEQWKEYLKVDADGNTEVLKGSMRNNEFQPKPYLNLPMVYVVTDNGWHIGPGGFRKSQDFSGWVSILKPKEAEQWMTDDLDELAEILRGKL